MVSPRATGGGQCGTGTGSYPSISLLPFQYHSSNDTYSFHLHVAVTSRTKGRKLGTFQKALIFRKSGSTGYINARNFCAF